MSDVLIWASVILAAVIVAAVAIALIGIFWKLKRGADHLEALVGTLALFRKQSEPLGAVIASMNNATGRLGDDLLLPDGAPKLGQDRLGTGGRRSR